MHAIVVAISLIVLVVLAFLFFRWLAGLGRNEWPDRGWYYDPFGRYEARLWNGNVWTAHIMASRDYFGHVGDPAIDPGWPTNSHTSDPSDPSEADTEIL